MTGELWRIISLAIIDWVLLAAAVGALTAAAVFLTIVAWSYREAQL